VKVILGLGNPGLRYKFSRHNLGFLVVERLAKAKRIRITRRAFNSLYGQGTIGEQEVLLAKPCTFVNLSGQAANSIVKRKKIDLKDLLVVCDDINLSLGEIRIRGKGSDGGHNGLRSIIDALGSQAFARLRIGVGSPAQRAGGLSHYVLGRFNRQENKVISETIEKAAGASELWIEEGIERAMNRFNKK
jgi:PTH1 family peptidyl-tRNA hydrolase